MFILDEMGGEAQTMALMCPHSPLGTGGESHPNASKVEKSKASFTLDEMGGEARTTVCLCPHSPLEIGGKPHPNASKVEGLVHFRQDGGRGPDNSPYVPP